MSSGRSPQLALATALVAVLLPLAFGPYLPSVDLPGHAAIASVLGQLTFSGGPATEHYLLRLPEIPYYLGYFYLTVAIESLGLEWGLRALVAIYAVATTLGLALLFRQLGAPAWAVLCAPFVVYSRVFVFGFVATFVGLPWILFGLLCLLRFDAQGSRRYAIAAGMCGLFVTLSHVFLWPVWLGFVAAFAIGAGRRAIPVALAVSLFSGLPILGSLAGGGVTGETVLPLFGGELGQVVDYVVDYGGTLQALLHAGVLAIAVGVVVGSLRSLGRSEAGDGRNSQKIARMGIAAVVLQFAIFVVAPSVLRLGNATAVNVNWRFLLFVEVALYLAAWPLLRGVSLGRVIGVAQAAAVATFVVGFAIFSLRFNEAMHELDGVLAHAEPGSTLVAAKIPYDFGLPGYDVPVLDHAYEYFLARGGGFVGGLWPDAHVPIRPKRGMAGAHRLLADGAGGYQPLWIGEADYLLAVDGSSEIAIPAPRDGVRVATSDRWTLYRRRF